MQRELPENRLRELREAKDLKLYDIAAFVRADPSTVWRWENNGSVPDSVKLALAEFYGVTPAYLMGWDEAPPSATEAA
jgi:transcriptional regulator with XRE-family HTH domain